MKILFISFAGIYLLLSTLQLRESEGWRGIVPLHSTRADVERLLGPSEETCNCFYKTKEAKIFVEYSRSRCKGFLTGWNVPSDTVLMISVQPDAEVRFSDLSVDLTKFIKASDSDTPTMHYTNTDLGIRYSVSESGIVRAIDYIPKRADYSLRCEGFPSVPDLGHRGINPFDSYSNISPANERARLDNFSIWLGEQPQMKGYILVYASRTFSARKAKLRGEHARNYLVKVRRLNANRVEVINGGYREQFQIELYILPANARPPALRPTIAPSRKFRNS